MIRCARINFVSEFIFFLNRWETGSSRKKCERGVTLVELMTVMVILGVSIGMFYSVWMSNWRTFDHHNAIADLWHDANQISQQMSMDGRVAGKITVALDQKSVDFENALGAIYVNYQMTSTGDFIITRGAAATTITDRIDYANSRFIQQGSSLQAELRLVDEQVIGGEVVIEPRMEVFPRN